MTAPPLRTVRSAGGVVCDDRDDGRRWVLLIVHRNLNGTPRWTLPKGRIEDGETSEVAALREVREETGHGAEIVAPLITIDYRFLWRPEGVRYHKFVDWFLMRWDGRPPGTPDGEVEHIEWVPYDVSLMRLEHRSERDLVRSTADIVVGGTGA
jgi:8-oxo-dGTP pyrophosphatase MutT (NUDIX family)